tara:strand:+ start:564 stop:908 length:345 start_codon:yes stop_codon:yes gene_type:complete
MQDSIDKYASTVEAKIAQIVVDHLLGAGFLVSVEDGEEVTVRRSRDAAEIRAALCTTGEDRLLVSTPEAPYGQAGGVLLIWGNGEDLISDYSVSLDVLMHTVMEAVDAIIAAAA